MAAYDKETLFYWLQFKEDFFDEDAIEWIEEQENGEKYVIFYLKLCLKSLKTNGVLIRKVGQILIPYDMKKLQQLTKTKDLDTVKVAMDLLVKIGLIQILDNGAIYLSQLDNLICSKSKGALKKQMQRSAKKLGVDKCLPQCPPELELELKSELEINLYSYLEKNFGRTISPIEYERLESWTDTFTKDIIKYAIDLSCFNNVKNINYINTILNDWQTKGFTLLSECQEYSNNRGGKNNESNSRNTSTTRDGSEYAEHD